MQTLDRKSLSAQLVFSLVGLVLLTALIVGLPAIWLIRNQLEGQAWAQIRQGAQATQALYAARDLDLNNLATLSAQRPSLRSLLQQADLDGLISYLETLREGADLDWVAVCDTDDKLIAQVAGEQPAYCRRAHAPRLKPRQLRWWPRPASHQAYG